MCCVSECCVFVVSVWYVCDVVVCLNIVGCVSDRGYVSVLVVKCTCCGDCV